ncbi:hypothetical protein D3C77_480110 [compost metagenome]
MQVAQAGLVEFVGLAADGEDIGLGVAEDDHAAVALALDQVLHLRRSGVDQQAVAVQQFLQALACAQLYLFALQAVQAIAQAAPPRGVDFFTQHALRQRAVADQPLADQPRGVQGIGSICYWYMSRHL